MRSHIINRETPITGVFEDPCAQEYLENHLIDGDDGEYEKTYKICCL